MRRGLPILPWCRSGAWDCDPELTSPGRRGGERARMRLPWGWGRRRWGSCGCRDYPTRLLGCEGQLHDDLVAVAAELHGCAEFEESRGHSFGECRAAAGDEDEFGVEKIVAKHVRLSNFVIW